MSFSDDDLKRLKDWKSNDFLTLDKDKMKALLARLEAAESVISAPDYQYDQALEEWCKAAGK